MQNVKCRMNVNFSYTEILNKKSICVDYSDIK